MSENGFRGFAGVPGRAIPIVQVGDPVLSTPCAPVVEFDDDLKQLIADMFASMYEAKGVGLAANQIGIGRRVFVYDCTDDNDQHQRGVVVNPLLVPLGIDQRRLDDDEEGCLSVLGQHALLPRPDVASVTGYDADGHTIEVHGTGLLARCLQHETDHLDGCSSSTACRPKSDGRYSRPTRPTPGKSEHRLGQPQSGFSNRHPGCRSGGNAIR